MAKAGREDLRPFRATGEDWGLDGCPVGPFRTASQAAIAAIALAAAVCFTVAVILERIFTSVMAALLVLLCGYVFWLQGERRQLRLRTEMVMRLSQGQAPVSKDAELDVALCAESLGVSLPGVSPTEGATGLTKVLLGALAKEYIRCIAAIKQYQERFGSLPPETTEAGPPRLPAEALLAHGGDAVDPGQRTPGPPSPEHQRRLSRSAEGGGGGAQPAQPPAPPSTVPGSAAFRPRGWRDEEPGASGDALGRSAQDVAREVGAKFTGLFGGSSAPPTSPPTRSSTSASAHLKEGQAPPPERANSGYHGLFGGR